MFAGLMVEVDWLPNCNLRIAFLAVNPLLRWEDHVMTGYARGASQQSTVCRVCTIPIPLETSKTDEHRKAVHEQCYVRKTISRYRRGSAFASSRTASARQACGSTSDSAQVITVETWLSNNACFNLASGAFRRSSLGPDSLALDVICIIGWVVGHHSAKVLQAFISPVLNPFWN
jgi:hypothetical protein